MARNDDRWQGGHPHEGRREDAPRRDEQRPVDTGDELVRALGRISVELARGLSGHVLSKMEARHRDQLDHHVRRWESKLERKLARRQQQLDRKLARQRERRARRYGSSSQGQAIVFAVLALMFFAFAAFRHDLWWLVFLGLAFGLRTAGILGYYADQKRERRDLAEREAEANRDPRLVRVDATCDKLLAALKDAPQNVRAFLSQPEQTVEALRKTAHELIAREAALVALANPEDDARLASERDGLSARVAAESDAVTKERLGKALDALDERRRQTEEMRRQASRLDAEHTRLSYTLEGLYAQVLRMKTAGTTEAGEGLKKSLDQLRSEVGALADALEASSRTSEKLADPAGPESFGDASAPKAPTRVRD